MEMCSGNNVWGSLLTYDYDVDEYYRYRYIYDIIDWNFEEAEVVCRQLGLPWSCMLITIIQ